MAPGSEQSTAAQLPGTGDAATWDAQRFGDLRRIEEQSLNVTQTARQLVYDGWLLRLLPGPTKRSRSVNAVLGSTLPLGQKIAHCEAVYAQAGLPTLFRLTPFDQPPGLAALLAERGYHAFDETRVQLALLDRPPEAAALRAGTANITVEAPGLEAFAGAVQVIRGTSDDQRRVHEARLKETPVGWRGFVAWRDGVPLAAGQVAYEEASLVGLYDLVTQESARGHGVASALCAGMLAWAWGRGARRCYLQVMSDNAAALAVYRKFGFADAYSYHYRGRPGECA
jgi:GNAT superfamily N-acetyltransferase